jgi:hypothetical protein
MLAHNRIKAIMKKLATALVSIALLVATAPPALAAEGDLGIALQVLEGGEGSSAGVNKNNSLWFVIEPGTSGTRDVVINSASDVPQNINLSIAARSLVDGQLRFDANATSIVNPWASYSMNNFILSPGDSQQVTVTITVPQSATREVLQPALLVKATGVQSNDAQYKIPSALQISQGIFLGVGTVDEFSTSFTIDDVFGQIDQGVKSLVVRVSNTGRTPIALQGDLQLSSATFTSTTIGPLAFFSSTIYPGEVGFAEIPVGGEVIEDRYRIQVRASQSYITITRNFEKNIDFRPKGQLTDILFWLGLILLSLILAVVSLRILTRKPFRPKPAGPVDQALGRPAVPSMAARATVLNGAPIRPSAVATLMARESLLNSQPPTSQNPADPPKSLAAKAGRLRTNIVVLFIVYLFQQAKKKFHRPTS